MRGFIKFVREQGVVGLAIGFILGAAIQRVVTSLVTDVIKPLIALALGGGLKTLDGAVLKIGSVKILYGHFFGSLLDFIIMAAVIYFLFKRMNLERLDIKKEEVKAEVLKKKGRSDR